jgi:hypothetical protein
VQDAIDPVELPRSLVRRRVAMLSVLGVMSVAEFLWPIATWPSHLINIAFYLYKLGWLAVIALACAFWVELYRFARSAGGTAYATGHVLLAILLTPLGILVLPELVQRDIASGRAGWQRRNALSTSDRILRTVLYLAALLAIAPPLYLVHRDLLYLAPVLAFLLQRLVLPWCRRTRPQAPDAA